MIPPLKPSTGWLLPSLLFLVGAPVHAQLQFASADGTQSFKIGLLGQFQAEAIDSAVADAASKNLLIRRFRILGQAQISPKLGVFFETDAPNLGKGNPDGSKNTQDVLHPGPARHLCPRRAAQYRCGHAVPGPELQPRAVRGEPDGHRLRPLHFHRVRAHHFSRGPRLRGALAGPPGQASRVPAVAPPGIPRRGIGQPIPVPGAHRLRRVRRTAGLFLPRHLAGQDAHPGHRRERGLPEELQGIRGRRSTTISRWPAGTASPCRRISPTGTGGSSSRHCRSRIRC